MMPSPQTAYVAEPVVHELPSTEPVQYTVMVIDDSPTIRAVVEAGLGRKGIHVDSFEDGIAAMSALWRGEVAVPYLVLLDVEMKSMSGYEVARILREKEQLAHTRIIMLTCHDAVWDKVRARLAGACEFIIKPFDLPYLIKVVRRYLFLSQQP